jgi:hypothetical protein
VAEPDDTEFVVYDEVVDERPRRTPAAVWLGLVLVVVLVVVLVTGGSHSSSSHSATIASVKPAGGRTVGDDKSLAAAYAGNRVLRALKARGQGTHGAWLTTSCTSTNRHDLGGGQSWDCNIRADEGTGGTSPFVVHVREDADGHYAGQLDRRD